VAAKKSTASDLVRAGLQHYATRGAFRSFSEVPARGSLVAFRFLWFRDVTFRVTFNPKTLVLTFVDALPAIPARSAMDRALRAFIASRSEKSVVEHRRVDLKKVGVTVTNKRGAMSIAFQLKPKHLEYGITKAVHLLHEVLMDFLNDSAYVEYNIDHFNLNPEMA
jgi:hypothetical protein